MTTPPLPAPGHADDALIRATFDGAPDGLAVIDGQGLQWASNDAYKRLWRIPAEMLRRRDAMEMRAHIGSHLADPQGFMDHVAATGAGPARAEFRLLDGRVLERQASPLSTPRFPGTSIVRWRDVTARVQAESDLKAALARLEAMFNHALNAILLSDDGGRFVDANPAACSLLGRPREQLRGLTLADVMEVPPDAGIAPGPGQPQPRAASGEVLLRRPDGSVRMARFNAVAHIQPGVHLSVLTDATDELLARQREVETAAQMDLAMANADIMFWSIDLVNDEVSANNPQRMEQMLGYPPNALPRNTQAWDALVHPDDFERREASWQALVDGSAATFEAEFRMRHHDGHWVWLLARGRAISRDAQGRATKVVGTRIDITRRKLAEQQLEVLAFTDGLTGVLNRRRFLDLAVVEVARARRHRQPVALLMIDLDHFKSVNDTHGHAGGDTVLQAFVRTALTQMRGSDLLGRMGGEEFAALLPQTDHEGAVALARRIVAQVQLNPVPLAAAVVAYTVSIGVAATRADAIKDVSIETLMQDADAALYRAKREGRNRVLPAPPR
ncbi:MAG: hypothetical protein RJA10_2648 [Pseudomonadota bacterium]